MMENKLKTLWDEGKPIINSWMASNSPFCGEVLAESGFDSITVDLQHGLNDYKDALSIFQAIGRKGGLRGIEKKQMRNCLRWWCFYKKKCTG